MRYVSICSGVDSATLAWEKLGWEPVFFAEVEPFPCAVLHHRFGASRPLRSLDPAEASSAKERSQRENWREDLKKGFEECFRVLEPHGVLVFKWNEYQVKLSEVLPLSAVSPLFCQRSGKTHWLTFMKGS